MLCILYVKVKVKEVLKRKKEEERKRRETS